MTRPGFPAVARGLAKGLAELVALSLFAAAVIVGGVALNP
jgi:hypothetical protein